MKVPNALRILLLPLGRLLALCVHVTEGLRSRSRNVFYRCLGVNIDGYVWMRAIEIPRNWSHILLNGPCSLDRGVTLLSSNTTSVRPTITIGKGTYINRNSIIDAFHSISIGERCMIGPNCFITDSNHGIARDQPIASQRVVSEQVTLGVGVWLGAGVIVLKGVTIGDGAVITAGAVVMQDIPSMAIAGGVPAKVIGWR